MVLGEVNYSGGETSPRPPKHSGGLREPSPDRLRRLAPEQSCLQDDDQSNGRLQYRPFCKLQKYSVEEILQLETRPTISSSGRSGSKLEELSSAVPLPPILSHRTLPPENKRRQSASCPPGGTPLALTDLVSCSPGNDSTRSQTPPLRSVASHRSPRESSPSTDTGAPEPSGLAHIRRSLQTQGIRGQAADLYCASWRGSTTSSYSSCWQRWFKWCRSKQTNPTEAPLAKIINFLTDLFLEGKEYSTINSYRSAISAIHIEQIGKDQVLNRFMQGIFNSRPPKPKYTWIWDVNVLLNQMKSMSDPCELSIQRLSQKVVTLPAVI